MSYKVVLYPILFLFIISCKSQNKVVSNLNSPHFSIETDSLKCGSNSFDFVTQYIRFSHPDTQVEDKVNKNLLGVLEGIYTADEKFNLKEHNKNCCERIESCDFNIQEYKIRFQNNYVASISYRNYMYSYTPGEFDQNINFNLQTGDSINIEDIVTEEGIEFLIRDINNTINNALIEESKYVEEDDKDILKFYMEQLPLVNKEGLQNFLFYKKEGEIYLKIYFSFFAANYENQVLPLINLEYPLNDIRLYLKERYKSVLLVE